MQVKIGKRIYKDGDEPVGVFLTAQDRVNILAMDPNRNFYCSFPKTTTEAEVKEFMTMPKPVAPIAAVPEEDPVEDK